jgi:hypothetical protein
MKFIKLLLSIGTICLTACMHSVGTYTVDNLDSTAIILNSWNVIGPFKSVNDENPFETDYFKRCGSNEASVNYENFKGMRPTDSLTGVANIELDASNELIIDFNKAFNLPDAKSIKGAVYAACTIRSSEAKRLKLNFAAGDASKIWLNNSLIFSKDIGTDIHPYENYIDLTLKKGENFLLIKVINIDSKWGMFASIEKESAESIVRHKRNFELRHGNYYLYRNIIENDSLKLTWGVPEDNYTLHITGKKDTIFSFKTNQYVNIKNLPDGFYTTYLCTNQDTFSSRFYKVKNVQDTFTRLISSLSLKSSVKKNSTYNGLLHRYNHLMKPENLPVEGFQKRDWDKKMLFILDNLFVLYNAEVEKNPNAGKGCLLRSYTSKIDKGDQYYILHIPNSYVPEKKIPLVIEMSKLMKWFPSPLETNRFANISLMEHFDDLANKYNMIIIEPGNRTVDRPNYNNIDEEDLWECVEDVKKAYNIDTARIYLRAACRASYDALKLAVKYPDRFAAISTVSPELSNAKDSTFWQHSNNPLNFLKNLKDHPFYNIHSQLDTHSTIKASEHLNEFVKKEGLKHYSYRKLLLEFKPYYSEEYLDDIFKFFSRSPALKQPSDLYFSTDQIKYNKTFWLTLNAIGAEKTATIDAKLNNNVLTITRSNISAYSIDLSRLPYQKGQTLTIVDNGKKVFSQKTNRNEITIRPLSFKKAKYYKSKDIEGPFSHVFTNKFIVVRGTGGDEQDKEKIDAVISQFNDDWKKRYYVDFEVKADKEITASDISSSNLILIGSPSSNLVLERLRFQLPLRVNNNSVSVEGETFDGTDLNYYFIYPNPENYKKYIAVIGYTNPSSFNVWEEGGIMKPVTDVSNFGWYDYKIWNGETSETLKLGYFDKTWN